MRLLRAVAGRRSRLKHIYSALNALKLRGY